MSAFICSDKHFAVVGRYMFPNNIDNAKRFANHLKRENIKSVNARYKENTRFKAVDMSVVSAATVKEAYTGDDVLQLLRCVDYQSCEHSDYDDSMLTLALNLLTSQGCDSTKSTLWSI